VKPNWPWLVRQVVVPLGGPIALSWVIISAWQTGNPDFVPQWGIALDITPWALVFYALALMGTALNELLPQISTHVRLGWLLIVTASLTQIYAAFLIIWRHNSTFVPNRTVYIAAAFRVLLAIVLSHTATSRIRGN
jgi:hypothetical protein